VQYVVDKGAMYSSIGTLLAHLGGHIIGERINVHKIVIESIGLAQAQFGLLMDRFLMTNLWWVMKKEIYNHRLRSDPASSTSLPVHEMVLVRFNVEFEPRLRKLAAIQYAPSQAICAASALFIGRMVGSGWGTQMIFGIFRDQTPYSVFNTWYTRNNGPGETTQLCLPEDCINILTPNSELVNKWECAFLPVTNCSMAELDFARCHKLDGSEEAEAMGCFPEDFFKLRDMNSGGGAAVAPSNPSYTEVGRTPGNPYQEGISESFPHDGSTDFLLNNRPFINAFGVRTKRRVPTDVTLGNFGLIFRPNYNLRSRVHIRLNELQKSDQPVPFNIYAPEGECVAIHIRRGDRVPSVPDMKQYCYLARNNGTIGRDNCTEELLAEVDLESQWLPRSDCGDLLDYGCFDPHSFGELTLLDYLRKAHEVAPGASRAFIMSDEDEWLDRELTTLAGTPYQSWRIGHLAAPPGARDADKNGTQYSVDFWASIAVARQCETFVGHFSSAVSLFVYEAMCFHFGASTGDCPAGADIGSSDRS